ncbi:MAG: aldo/keto reductase [Sulfolobales archaeon]
MSVISLGTWHLPRLPERDEAGAHKIDVEEFRRVLKTAYDHGVNFIDTANRYHGGISPAPLSHSGYAETLLGRLLRELGFERESLFIASKVGGQMASWVNGGGLSRKHVMWQIRESLKRLQLEYLDLYYAHIYDPDTPARELLSTFTNLVRSGFVRYIGVSNIPAPYLSELMLLSQHPCYEPVVALQYKYNLLERDIERDIIPIAQRFGAGVVAYSPLAQGFLTGKYYDPVEKKWRVPELSRATYSKSLIERYFIDKYLVFMSEYIELAKSLGITPAQLALAWILKRSEDLKIPIVPIIGVSNTQQLLEAIESLEVKIDQSTMRHIDELVSRISV